MPNEIYHRSNWGNPNPEGWGDIYFDPAATNKLYNHSDYYENSDGTDKILRDIPNKASITLTPTAYSDGSINTVIPPYQVLPTELVPSIATIVNLSGGSITQISGNSYSSTSDGTSGSPIRPKFDFATTSGKTYKLVITPIGTVTGTVNFDFYDGSTYLFQNYDFTTTKEITFTDNGNVFGAFDGTQTYSVSNFTISIKEIQEADFDFSRGSSATRVNEKGLIEDVQILSGELVQNGDFEQIGSELVTNGSFDTDSNWTKGAGTTISNSNANFVNATDVSLYQNIGTQSGFVKVTFSVTNYSNGTLNVYSGGNQSVGVVNVSANALGNYVVYVNRSGGNVNIIFGSSDSFTGSIDNVSVKEVGQNWLFQNGWSMGDGVAVYSGTVSAYRTIYQQNVLTVSSKYRLTFDIVSIASGSIENISQGSPTSYSTVGTKTEDFIATNTDLFLKPTTDADLTIDNISIKEITDDTDLPRIDYTTGFGSWLLEPQSINLITYSEDFSNVAWEYSGDVAIESGYTAPDGSNTAYKVTGTNAPLAINASATSTQTRSIYAKTLSGTGTVQLLAHNSNTNNIFTITPQWQRFEINNTTSSIGELFFYAVDFRGASTTLSEVVLWGAQLEDLSYATSYIPTNGSAVTRAAETANNSGNADLFNDSEGVLYAEIAALADDLTNRNIALSDNTTNNRIVIVYTNTSNQIRFYLQGSGGTITIHHTLTDETDFVKLAIKYKAQDFSFYVNGVEVDTNTSNITFSGLNDLSFYNPFGGGTSPFYGKVKELAVFKEALTDAELESLTSWISFTEMATDLEYTVE